MVNLNLRDKPQSPIFKESIEQLGKELSQFFRDKDIVPTYLVKSDDDDLKDVAEKKSQKFAIPFFTYKINNSTPNNERFNRKSMFRQGIRVNKISRETAENRADDPNQVYETHHLQITDLNFDIAYYCSYDEQYDFVPLWQQAALNHYLNFQMELGESLLSFNVELVEDVTFAEIDFDSSRYVKCMTSLVLTTYHGVVSTVKPVNSWQLNTGIVSKGNPEAELVPSLEIKRTKSKTFKIKDQGKDVSNE